MKKLNKYMLPIMIGICLISIIVMVVILQGGSKEASGKFEPPAFDTTAVKGIPEVSNDLGYTPIDVEKGFKAFVCGELHKSNNAVDVYFTSAKENTVWMKLKLLDENDQILGETGVIKPGEYVQSVKLNTEIKSSQKVKLKIIAYTVDTWYSAGTITLNTILQME